jgi:conjugal transfer pilus assembly protein TraV
VRLWIAPWEDSEGDLHEASVVHLVIDQGRWQMAPPASVPASPAVRPLGGANPPGPAQAKQVAAPIAAPSSIAAPVVAPNATPVAAPIPESTPAPNPAKAGEIRRQPAASPMVVEH